MNYSIGRQLNALILLIAYITSAFCLHSISKRYQLPVSDPKNIPQTDRRSVRDGILDRFHITPNTIIRTHDSRALGAKYLNETELSSNEDCLYWCWQTSSCNLAVYEQKTRGSCYLFDCGSNEDFHCKFTGHNFYTSSVLQVNRHSYDLSQWGSQVQHEKELTKLRSNAPFSDITVSPASRSSTPSVRNLVAPSIVPTTTATMNFQKTSHCLHYQFECRNNTECIAIYNVCDGIPQCSDGSDEAFDLECHKSRFNTPNTEKSDHLNTQSINSGQTLNNKKIETKSSQKMSPIYPIINENKSPQLMPIYNYPKTANSDNARPPDDQQLVPKKPNFNGPEESNVKNSYPSQYRNSWNPYYQQNDGYNSGDNSRASGGYLVEPEYINNGYNNRENSNTGSYWPSIGRPQSYDLSDQMGGQTYRNNKPLTGATDEWTPNNANNNYESNYYDHISRMRPNVGSESISDSKSFGNSKQTKSDSVLRTKQNLSHKYEKQLKSQSKSKEDTNKAKLFNKVNISYSHISSNKGFANSPGIVAVSYMHDTSQQNGRETNSAVIALSLGLFVTALLIVLVGCRMKSFKRKIARRGRPLAHDADYLVNGMYL